MLRTQAEVRTATMNIATAHKAPNLGLSHSGACAASALLIILLALAFAKSYISGTTFSGKPVSVLIHIHTASMVMWLFMLVAQGWLIHTRRFRLHRLIGRASFLFVPFILIVTVIATHENLNAAEITPVVAQLEVTTWGQIVPFGILWGLAIYFRKVPSLHVRFMISTAFAIGTAIVFRVLLAWIPGLENLDHGAAANWTILTAMLLFLIASDWLQGVYRSPYWVVTAFIAVMHIAYYTIGKTDGWYAFVRWFAGLPL